MRSFAASEAAKTNTTSAISENDEEELFENMNLTTFKERYRRLIPYMTFYVANNYLHAQATLEQNYAKDPSTNLLRKSSPPQQHPLIRLSGVPRRGSNKYRVNLPGQDNKFVPSVQFDPRNIGGDNDYFAPVKYSTKINYADYSTPSYQLYQIEKAYPEITTPSSQILHKENRYFVTARPLRPPVPPREQHFVKKPPLGDLQDDYDQDTAKIPNVIVNYPSKEFDGLRYIPPPIHANVQQQSVKSSVTSHIYRKPNVNINNLIESFQLSEQLPETLNKDNIDSSIRTLLEILNILHNSRQENPPQSQGPLPQPQGPLPSPPRLTNYKPKTYTRPKVITETRFQATPNPLLITDDPERYKIANDGDVQIKTPLQPYYNVNHIKDEKVEYYIPYIQDISNKPNQQRFRPTPRPDTTEHTYEITEDLSDDILPKDEPYTLPISTEASISQEYVAPNEITRPGPKTSLKYGATRGKPHIDYPAYAIIPETDFNCKDQRYKGFFGDPATRCQVWHYCDLNGGKSSFLCPNGTIFSQVALTCDWWFNVKCETTTQLYVLNERLYKYILPIMPKFPEDFTGPEVDRYLELKFKEMEAKLKEKKLKKQQEEKDKHKGKTQTSNDEE
ncbi:U-scoloptoxin(01)-Er1a [Formica fusca]